METYRAFCKDRSEPGPVAWEALRATGFKKPLVEADHASTRRIFGPSVGRIDQLYCLRDVHENFNSLAGAFGYTPDVYKRRIGQSIDGLRATADDPLFRYHPVHLNDFLAAEDRGAWAKARIFDPLGADLSLEESRVLIAATVQANRTPDARRRPGITEAERAEIAGDAAFVAKVRWLEDRFEVSLLDRG